MSCFSTISGVTASGQIDSTKHVNYTAGMILGVNDFTQEFAYLAGRDRWLARDALGYGTVSGLSVGVEADAERGFRVMIQPGVAVSPRGQLVCVGAAQCAYLNQWLAAADAKDLSDSIRFGAGGSPIISPPLAGAELTLYVVLCYRDCLTDDVPIPGEPCRSEDELSAASRVKDDFSLELRFKPAKQTEENAVRRYVEWLKQIEVVDAGESTPLADFVQAIRDEWLNAPASSPPVPPVNLRIPANDYDDYLRAAFRLWTTELRNVSGARETGCAVEMTGAGSVEDCVLLAELRVPLEEISSGWKVGDNRETEIIEDNRPFLLHLRMLQEWMLNGCCRNGAGTIPPIFSPPITSPPLASPPLASPPIVSPPVINPPAPLALDDLSDVAVPTPTNGQILTFRRGEWIAADSRALKPGDAAGGDLTGDYPNPTINLLQGEPIQANIAKNVGDALVWNGSAWTPQPQIAAPSPPAEPFLLLPLATITRRDNNNFEVWFNLDAPGNLAEIKELNRENLRVADETENDPTFLEELRFVPKRVGRNIFLVVLRTANQVEPDFLRFGFDVEKIMVSFDGNELSLFEYAEKHNIKFAGFSQGKLATVFVRGTGFTG